MKGTRTVRTRSRIWEQYRTDGIKHESSTFGAHNYYIILGRYRHGIKYNFNNNLRINYPYI